MSKKKRKKGKKGEKKKEKQKQKQKHTTQKTHRPYSSLDLTYPNFAFGRIFFTILLESKISRSDFEQNLLIWFEFL